MFKKMLTVLTIGCFLLGMATKVEAENVEEQIASDTTVDSVAFDVEDTDRNTDYKISATIVSKVTQGDTITNVIYGETEMEVSKARSLGIEGLEQKRADEEVKVKYPKVLMMSERAIIEKYGEALVKSIKFFDKRGEVKKEIDVQGYISDKIGPARVGTSPNQKYLRINAPTESFGGKEVQKSKIVVFNADGDSLWGFEHKLQNIHLSPNGEYMVGVPDLEWGSAPVFVYDKNGEILKKIEKEDQAYDLSFSENGNYFALLVTRIDWEKEVETHKDRIYDNLFVVDFQGNELWERKRIAEGDGVYGEVKVSNDTITVMTGLGEFKLYYFDRHGNLLKTEPSNLKRAKEFKD